MNNKLDLKGFVSWRLTAIKPTGRRSGSCLTWWCQCSCGNPKLVEIRSTKLRKKLTKSCGCLRREKAIRNLERARRKNRKEKRNRELIRLRKRGWTCREIAGMCNISPEAVRQVMRRYGGTKK